MINDVYFHILHLYLLYLFNFSDFYILYSIVDQLGIKIQFLCFQKHIFWKCSTSVISEYLCCIHSPVVV